MTLYQEWLKAKKAEANAQEKRREIEDKLAKELKLNQNKEGVHSFLDEGYEIKVTTRFNRKVNPEQVKDIAISNGLESYIASLFRWKPELNVSAWKATEKSITDMFSHAVTTTPGRPSFQIKKQES